MDGSNKTDRRPAVVAVAGPTATGKTALGVALALRFGGEIISADSMQIYRGLDVGTAKVTAEEAHGVPHHCVDILPPEAAFSVADFTALAAPSRQGPDALLAALAAERDRQTAARLTAPEIAEKLDLGRLARFFGGEAFRRVLAADSVLREYAFITALPAGAVLAAQGQPPEAMPPAAAGEQVLVQGIADILLVFPDHLELLDYKTDRGKREADFLAAYRPQLNLYALAIEKRFAPKKVTYKGIFSLELGKLIDAG